MNKQSETNPYCLVTVCHYESTGKILKCKDCVMDCKYKESEGNNNDKPTD